MPGRHASRTWRRPGAVVLAVGALVALAGCRADAPASTTITGRVDGSARAHTAPATPGKASADRPARSPGPAGVRSAAIVAENAKPGDPSWRIAAGANRRGFIEGFADRTDARGGQQVTLRVSTSARTYRVTAYRMGWYAGAGGRAVWRSTRLPGSRQPACGFTPGVNLVSCDNWTPSLTISVGTAFVPGDYLFKLVGSGGQQGYVPLTVWDPASTATYLVKNDVFTWQAWNTYGGYDYYAGPGACPPNVYPLCSRARVVSFDRPYDPHSAGFLALEAPLVRHLERRGLDVSYVTDVTVARHPAVLARHRVLLSLGHDECWSLRERLAAVRAKRQGTSFAFFGASGMLRHVRLQGSPLGAARQLVDYRNSEDDPLYGTGHPRQVTGNTWSDPPASWSGDSFVGEAYNGFLEPGVHADLTVSDARSWAFRGAGVHNGDRLPGVIASDVDGVVPGMAPPSLQVLNHTEVPVVGAQAIRPDGATFASDMTYYTDPRSGAGVWDSGTNNWIPALEPGHGVSAATAHTVRRITDNVLRVLGGGRRLSEARPPSGRRRSAGWRP